MQMQKAWIFVLALGVLCGAPGVTASAQTALATLRGSVVDEQGGALPGVTVTVREVETNTIQTTVTGAQGQYFLPNLRPGSYEVLAELPSFGPVRETLQLRVGQDLTVNVTMGLAALQESVQVVGKSVPVETQSTLATIISNSQIDDLPTIARNFSDLATLAPGLTTSDATGTGQGTGVSVAGQRPFSNNIVVDGSSNLMSFYGRQANDFPQDWIQEFQVLTSSFSAEYGQASGGLLNVITRSGANRTNGRVYGFFRDAKFDSPPFAGRYDADKKPIFLTSAPPYDQQRAGGFMGGPVRKDKVFYFAALERVQRTQSDVLAISEYWRQFVTDTIIPMGHKSTVGLIKVDMNLNNNNRAYFRYTNTHKRDSNMAGTSPGAPGPLATIETRSTFGGPLWNIMGNWTTTLRGAFNELRVSYGINKPWILSNLADRTGGASLLDLAGYNDVVGNPTGEFATRSYPGGNFGATSFTGLEGEGNLFVINNFSFTAGRHQFKVGAQITRQTMYMDVEASHKGRWSFTTDRVFDINDPASYPSSFSGNIGSGKATPTAISPSFYLQDTWQVTNNVTLNLGVRYDLDNSPTTVNQYVDAYNTRIVERLGGAPPLEKSVTDKNNFAPRLGVVWVPTADRKTTLRASGGVYYDQNHWNITDIYINETLLAKRRINLNANSAANNPFWTPGNTAVGIAQMRAFLAEKFPAYPDLSALPFPLEAILAVEPHYKIPYSVNFAAGITRQISNTLTARADYVRTRTYDSMRGPDTNWAVTSDGRYVRKDTRYGNITIIGNGGSLWYNGLETRVDYRPSATARVGLSYTLSKAMSDTATGLSTGGSTNPFDPSEDYGPDNNDRRHNLVVDATYLVPRIDLQLAGTTAYRSALPYTITTSFQLDTDPFSDRPEPRNSRRGDASRITDLRASKIFRFGRYTATAFWEVFNVFNVDNWRNPSGNLESSNFGLSLAQGPKRQQQFGFRFDF